MILFNDTVKIGSHDVKVVVTKSPRPVTITMPLTKQKLERNDFIFFALGDSSELYVGAKRKFYHYNLDSISPPHPAFKQMVPILSEYDYIYRFCNDVKGYNLQQTPEAATMELTINLEKPNPASSFGTPRNFLETSVDLYEMDKQIKCKVCNSFMSNEEPIICLYNRTCPRCIINRPPENPLPEEGFLGKRKDHEYYQHFNGMPSANISEYYKVYKKDDMLNDDINIPKKEFQMIVLGLGSAGTNIIDQLMRFREMKQFFLLDYDRVEVKNLRNQLYTADNVGNSKVFACASILRGVDADGTKEIQTINDRYASKYFKYYKSRYIVLGFDSIRIRLDVFNDIADGKVEVDYIIDTRYNELEASIYFINVQDEKQMAYYHRTLLDDLENLSGSEKELVTEEQMLELYRKHDGHCYSITTELGMPHSANFCQGIDFMEGHRCGSEECIKLLTHIANTSDRNPQENTCTRWDIIDVYKYASSYITAAVRQVEQGKKQPFIHIEVCTDPMPAAMPLPINHILKEEEPEVELEIEEQPIEELAEC